MSYRAITSVAVSLLIAVPLVIAFSSDAYGIGCTGPNCTVSVSSPSPKNPNPKPSSPSPTYLPIYPPPEPTCVDQGGNIRPYSVNSNLTINGQTYDDEYIDCSSTGAANYAATKDLGTLTVITQSPNNSNPSGNPSCGALSWWVNADTAYGNHRNGSVAYNPNIVGGLLRPVSFVYP
jgi:hypothetical protein